jgi:hypothetical protein
MTALPEAESNLAVAPSHIDQTHLDQTAVIILKRLADRAQARLNAYRRNHVKGTPDMYEEMWALDRAIATLQH